MAKNNNKYKYISKKLKLSDREVAHMLDGEFSKSKINAWGRNEDSIKSASGNTTAKKRPRFREMSDYDYDEFIKGLSGWVSSYEEFAKWVDDTHGRDAFLKLLQEWPVSGDNFRALSEDLSDWLLDENGFDKWYSDNLS